MMTSWPKGSALGKPRKRRQRPPSKVVREQRRIDLTTSQVVRKLVRGREFDATVPRSADSPEVRNLECCTNCGGPLRLVVLGADGLCTLLPRDGRCGQCRTPFERVEPSVRRIGVTGGKLERSRLIGAYRPILAPAEGSPDIRAGVKLGRMVRANTTMF